MGGRIALGTALSVPGLVDRLVLESAHPGIEDAEERRQRVALADERAGVLLRDGTPAFVDAWYRAPMWASLRRQSRRFEEVIRRRGGIPAAVAAQHVSGLSPGRMPNFWARLGELGMPTLLVAGAEDPKYRAAMQRAASLIPAARLAIAPGAGHNVHLECPDIFLRELTGFLSPQSPSDVSPEQ